jgi:hypothetical protein
MKNNYSKNAYFWVGELMGLRQKIAVKPRKK